MYLPRRFYYGALLRIGKQATLLTGDFNEPSQKDIADIKNWIDLFKQEIGVFLVPHHGAKNIKITNYSFSPVSIISFGIHNRHRHPTGQVLKAIAQSNTNLICVNEANGFCYYVE